MRLTLVFLFALIFVLISINLNAQVDSKKVFTQNGTTFSINSVNEEKGKPVNYLVVEQPQQSSQQSHEKRLIVKFKSEPLAKNTLSAQGKRASLDNEHQRFLDDLQLLQQSNSAKSAPSTKILNEYKTVFNGFSIIASSEIEQHIKDLPYVESVTEDKKVETVDQTSNQIINADKVWTELNSTGRGVVIGIIDTGIDYTHPDLGGGIGATSKVIGGYDFVNEDSDPIDDHGHGTHVAGIAAANGAIKGVAPDAKLMAFKVLTAEGWGYDSWILAAIERAVDPDQNPNTNDALDVVNMSLGRYADSNEPFSEAIHNATLVGVTFVVAAGNNWNYQTIGTPGVAESAITVAATDQWDITAYFSSKGPTDDYYIKPDVAAPGVDIYSTFLGSQYQTLSGTSMASPHVAGAVALLLEEHPDWSPETIKAVLMNTAKKSTESLWYQGAGRIDALQAIESDFVLSPGSISLGLLNTESETTFKATLYNYSSQTENFSLALSGDILQPAISYTIEPSSVTLGSGQSVEITVTLSITGSLDFKNFTDGYFGELLASCEDKTVRSPIAFIHSPVLKLQFPEELPGVVIIFRNEIYDYWKLFYPSSPELNVVVNAGSYDIVTMFDNQHLVINENIDTHINNNIILSKSQASNRQVFSPLDIDGNPLIHSSTEYSGLVCLTGLEKNIITFYPYLEDTIYVSDNMAYRFNFKLSKNQEEYFYDISGNTPYSVNQDILVSNSPSNLREINIITNEGEQGFIHKSFGKLSPSLAILFYNNFGIPFLNSFKIFQSQETQESIWKSDVTVVWPPTAEFSYDSVRLWNTVRFSSYKGDSIVFSDFFNETLSLTTFYGEKFDYELGKTMLRFNGRMSNTEGTISFPGWYPSSQLFKYYYGERRKGNINYELLANSNVLTSGVFTNSVLEGNQAWELGVTPQSYLLRLNFTDYSINGRAGQAKAELTFDTSQGDKNPPYIKSFSLESNGLSTDKISFGEEAKFKIVVRDVVDVSFIDQLTIASVRLYIRPEGEPWSELALSTNSNGYYETSLSPLTQEGYYDLKLTAQDNDGNSFTYELMPGFVVTSSDPDALEPVSLLAPANGSANISHQPVFQWSIAPLALSYTLQLSQSANFTLVESEQIVTSPSFSLFNLNFSTSYYWRVRANYAGGSSTWSDTFSFTTEGEISPVVLNLITPFNNSEGHPPHEITFEWTTIDGAQFYIVEFSYEQNFSSLEKVIATEANVVTLQDFTPQRIYYWKVGAHFSQNEQLWSDPFSFSTAIITNVNEGLENDHDVYAFPNPFTETVTIGFKIDSPGTVLFEITDSRGVQVDQFDVTYAAAGKHSVHWKVKTAVSGIYFCKVISGDAIKVVKLILRQ